jgi:outer membrane immunogenic protein
MRTVLSGVLLATSFASSPSFAQLTNDPAPPRWHGSYVGLNGGYGTGTGSFDESATSTSTSLGTNELLSGTGKNSMSGALLGGQIGYNWKLSAPWLVGAEADWQWTSQRGSNASCTPPGNTPFFGAGGNGFGYCLSNQQEIANFGTARIRGGRIVRNESLWYVTGGLAWGTVKDTVTFTSSSSPVIFPFAGGAGPYAGTGSSSSTKLGWTIGFGVETKVDARWSVKLEFLHADLGRHTQTVVMDINPAFGAGFTNGGSATTVFSTRVTDDLVRIGLSYQFGR